MVAYKNYKKGDYTAALNYLNKSGEDKKANDAKIFINEYNTHS